MPKKNKKKNKKFKKKIKKITKKNILKTSSVKTTDEKVQIKKITKQPVEKRIYNIKDYVVYPKHGVGKIVSVDILAPK